VNSLDSQDLFSRSRHSEISDNPYPFFRTLLTESPWVSPSGYLVFARYADVMAILRDPSTFGQERLHYPNFHVADPPEHTRLRGLVSKAFTPRAINQQRETIHLKTGMILDEFLQGGTGDFIPGVARRLPAAVIADMLGVPLEDAHMWHQWMDEIHQLRGSIPFHRVEGKDSEAGGRAEAAAAEMANYFKALIADRRGRRTEDLVTGLLEARELDDRLTDEEILYTLVLLLGAGGETTSNQIGNTLRIVLDNPGTWETMRNDPDLVGRVVDESLRLDGTLQAEYRVTRKACELEGVDLQEGQPLIILNAAANRDPAVFDNPDEFNPWRENPEKHLTFGWGIHRCLGAHLARTELTILFEGLTKSVSEIWSEGSPVQHSFNRLRGLESLPIGWTKAA